MTADRIEPNYSAEEIREALRFADIIVALSVIGVLDLPTQTMLESAVLEMYKLRMVEA